MLLSGRGLFRIDEKLIRDETWPAAFGKSGYTTFISGKWHNDLGAVGRSFQQGRAIFASGMANPLKAKLSNLVDGKLGPPEITKQHACAAFADEAIHFLGEQRTGPFLCYIPFDAPHDPHVVPADFPISYRPQDIPLPPNFLSQHPWNNGEMTIRDEQLLSWPRKPHDVQELLAEYYQYISYLDAQIGRILDALDASPYAKNTIVVFSADSGVARGSHGLIGKQNCYEHSMRVPLIIAGPGIPSDQRTQALCYLFDVFPTLGRRCGVTAPTTSEGADFSAVFADPKATARNHILLAYKEVQRAISDQRWKLIRYPLVNKTQLFDLQADPYEVNNLAENPDQTAMVVKLTTQLQEQLSAFGDPNPLTVANPASGAWTPPAPGPEFRKNK
jgi:arylsulfatase A-like enzyme